MALGNKFTTAVLLILISALQGCSAVPPSPLPVTVQHAAELDNSEQQSVFLTDDGTQLGYAQYRSTLQAGKAALIYLHGIESHAGWFHMAAKELSVKGYDVFCLDRRGSGMNRENRGLLSGHVDSYQTLFDDIHSFIKHIDPTQERIVLLGLSWGGKLAMAFSLAHPKQVDAVVLITPGIRPRADITRWAKLQILFSSWLRPKAQFKTPLTPEMFTDKSHFQEIIRKDPLRLRSASASFFIQSAKLDRLLNARIEQNELPLNLYLAGRDPIIDNTAVETFLQLGAQQELHVVHFPQQVHSIQFELPERLADEIDDWLTAVVLQ